MKFLAIVSSAILALASSVASQCAYYPQMGVQMQQLQLALQSQMDTLAGLSGWNTLALQTQYMNQLAAINNQMGHSSQVGPAAYTEAHQPIQPKEKHQH